MDSFIVLLVLALILLAGYLVLELVFWLVDWQDRRRERAEAELDRKQEQLRVSILALAENFNLDAHEARKALIRESFLASGMVPPRD